VRAVVSVPSDYVLCVGGVGGGGEERFLIKKATIRCYQAAQAPYPYSKNDLGQLLNDP